MEVLCPFPHELGKMEYLKGAKLTTNEQKIANKLFTFIRQIPRFGQLGFREKGGEGYAAGQGLRVVKRTIQGKGCAY